MEALPYENPGYGSGLKYDLMFKQIVLCLNFIENVLFHQIGASLVVPSMTFLIMWLLRRKPYEFNADTFLVAVAFLFQPLAQVLLLPLAPPQAS